MCPTRKDPITAIQEGSFTTDQIIKVIKKALAKQKQDVQQEVVAQIKEYDEATREVISKLVEHIKVEGAYQAEMLEEEFLKKY